MRRLILVALTLAFLVAALPVPAGAAARPQQQIQTQGGTVQGIARDAQQQPIRNANVQLRNVQTGQIAATGRTGSTGEFMFGNIPAGTYIVEVVDSKGALIAITAPFPVTAGSVAGVTVTASAAGAAAAAGGGGLFGLGTAGTVLGIAGAAAAVGITAMVVTKDNKIVICHKAAGTAPQTITISDSAKDSHLAHGDTLGACPISPAR